MAVVHRGRVRPGPGTCGAGSGRRGSARRRTPADGPPAHETRRKTRSGVLTGASSRRAVVGVGGLAPQGLLGAVDGEVRRRRRTARRASRPGRAGRGPGSRARGYQPFSSAIGWPSARRTRSSRQAAPVGAEVERLGDVGRRLVELDPEQPGRGGQPAPAHVLAERRQVQPALQPRAGDERALAVDPVQQPVGDQALDRLAHRGPRDVVRRHQLALRRDRRVRVRARAPRGRPARR